MFESTITTRDIASLVVRDEGRLVETGNTWEPYQLVDSSGVVVQAAAAFLSELQAQDCTVSTLRSYGYDLLLWWRWLTAVGVPWDKATRAEGRDFARWLKVADKPRRPHWRHRDGNAPANAEPVALQREPSATNRLTGKAGRGQKFAPSSRGHLETVLRTFYDFQLEVGQGPLVNPFPLDRSRRAGRANAHRNPMQPAEPHRKGRYRPKVPKRIPKRIPDEHFNQIFAGLKCHRDRALLAFFVSTGARSEELLDSYQGDVDPGDQLIAVTRKGTRRVQRIPASPDAFVWLRLYQEESWRRGAPRGRHEPLWFTIRRPFRPLTYPAARAMLGRAQSQLQSNWTLHDLRHTAAWRMAQDPNMPLTDVQWVLGHESLSTTQRYTTPAEHEVIASVLAHHRRRGTSGPTPGTAPPAPGYSQSSLNVLFGRPSS
ncbi:tyrosine-type recombinase/integrase [Nocardia tengchongensis]|uniref:tyrosine-type recombinase/integrase n=1 Tax=Nocardia tengchongensis TaxID=2055889 RepID=UPI0036590224